MIVVVDRVGRPGGPPSAPVVWVKHSSDELQPDTEPWRFVADLPRNDGDPVVHKRHGDAFEDTDPI